MMNRAYPTVAAGMAGMRALASGSLLLGTRARASAGIQTGNNLRAGIWSKYGDHGIFWFTPSDVSADLIKLSSPTAYDEAVAMARSVVNLGDAQSVVNGLMLAALHCS